MEATNTVTTTVGINITARHEAAKRKHNLEKVISLGAVIGLLLLFIPGSAYGQLDRTSSALPPGATVNFRFAEPNELPITVTLLGAVQRPGRYEISRKIDLVNLFALSGGWLTNADLSDVHISRMRGAGTNLDRFDIKLDLDDISDLSQTFVQLQEGDCVYIGISAGVSLPVVLSVISTAAAMTTAIFYITQLNR